MSTYRYQKPSSGYRLHRALPPPEPESEPQVRGVPRGAALWMASEVARLRPTTPPDAWPRLAVQVGRGAERRFGLGTHPATRRLASRLVFTRTPQQGDALGAAIEGVVGQLMSEIGMFYIAQEADPSLVEAARRQVLKTADRLHELVEAVEDLVE